MPRPTKSLHRQRTNGQPVASRVTLAWGLPLLFAVTACRHPAQKPVAATTAQGAPSPVPKSHRITAATRTIEPVASSNGPLVGRVRVIGAHGSFVLIETPSAFVTSAVPAGCLLRCRPPGAAHGLFTGDLRVTPERRPPFLVADVVSGQPAVGDAAYVVPEGAPTPTPAAPVIPYSSVLTPPPAATPEPQ